MAREDDTSSSLTVFISEILLSLGKPEVICAYSYRTIVSIYSSIASFVDLRIGGGANYKKELYFHHKKSSL